MTTPGVSHPSPTMEEDFRRVLDGRAVQPLFQPLIDLQTRHVLGYEALARGPMGSALESPAALFGAAWRAGRVAELDWGVALDEVGAAPASLAVLPFVFGYPAPLPSEMPPPTEAIPLGKAQAATGDATPGRWSPRPGRRAGSPRTCWPRPACSWSTRAWTRPSPTSCWPASRTPPSSPRPSAAAMSPGHSGGVHRRPRPRHAGHPGRRGPQRRPGRRRPLRGEWDLIVIGPRFAAALVANDLGDQGPDDQRRYDVVVTHDRELVIRAAEPLLRRLVPEH